MSTENEIKEVIESITKKAKDKDVKAADALHYTQAILNAANAIVTLKEV